MRRIPSPLGPPTSGGDSPLGNAGLAFQHVVGAGRVLSVGKPSPLAVRFRPAGTDLDVRIDTTARKRCKGARLQLVRRSLRYIWDNITQLPNRVTANCDRCQNMENQRLCNGQDWGGHSTGSPRALVRDLLSSGRLTVRCEGRVDACKEFSVWAHVDHRDVGDRRGSVYMCRHWLDAAIDYIDTHSETEAEGMVEEVASVLVHEIYHLFGADEVAARAMTPFRGVGSVEMRCGDSYSGG